MSELIIEVTETSIEQDVLTASGPVLLDLWAPWCGPCRALAPVLKKLSTEYEGSLQIAKVDVEKYPQIQERFGVRGIPTMILFRSGEEAARAVGVKSANEMRLWLEREGVTPLAAMPVEAADAGVDAPANVAFHGDPELRDFLVSRLKARVLAGRVKCSRMPYWVDGKGTISTAAVSHDSLAVFQGVTGMPASFACALEFCCMTDPTLDDIEAIFASIPVGADLRGVAPKLLLVLMDGSYGDWSALCNDAKLDALRLRWLDLARRSLAGEALARDTWNALTAELSALQSKDLPERCVQDGVISVLTSFSPLPAADDAGGWANGLLMHATFLQFILAGSLLGWTTEDFGMEIFRHNWFTERQKQEPAGEFTPESLEVARGEWMLQHGDLQRQQDAFFERYEENMAPVNGKLRSYLAGLLRGLPNASHA